MEKSLKKELKLKDGSTFPKGTAFGIAVKEDKPMIAVLTDASGREIKIASAKLYRYFPGFVVPFEEIKDPDFDSTIVPSLTGEMVEPDGWDENGFPSVLLAIGYV